MTLRQLWVRFMALPADSPLRVEIAAAQEKATQAQQVRDIDDVLAQFQRPKGD